MTQQAQLKVNGQPVAIVTPDESPSGAYSYDFEGRSTIELRMTELDQTDPAGRYRLRVTGDVLSIQRATSADWATTTTLMSFDASKTSLDAPLVWNTGAAPTAAAYWLGRNNDSPNRLQANVPTGALLEVSVNGVEAITVGAGQLIITSPSAAVNLIGRDAIANAILKTFRVGVSHYLNAEEPAAGLQVASADLSNVVYVGGGTSLMNTATEIRFYTAANTTTVTGTQRASIDLNGNFIQNGAMSIGTGTAPVSGTKLTLPLENDAATPTFAFGDGDSGIYEISDDLLGIAIAGALTGSLDSVGMRRKVSAGLTASTTQTQGQGALTAEVNEVSTVANASDTVTLPTAVTGRFCLVINNGANTLQVFPASGDDLGGGVDTATTIASGSRKLFVAFDATNWEPVI